MLETDNPDSTTTSAASGADAPSAQRPAKAAKATKAAPRKRAAKKAAPAAAASDTGASAATDTGAEAAAAPEVPVKAAPRKRAAKKAAPAVKAAPADVEPAADAVLAAAENAADAPLADASAAEAAPAKRAPRKRTPKKAAADVTQVTGPANTAGAAGTADAPIAPTLAAPTPAAPPSVLFVPPTDVPTPARRTRRVAKAPAGPPVAEAFGEPSAGSVTEPVPADADITVAEAAEDATAEPDDVREAAVEEATGARRRRRRGRRGRGGANRATDENDTDGESPEAEPDTDEAVGELAEAAAVGEEAAEEAEEAAEATGTRRRRRRRRSGGGGTDAEEQPATTVARVRAPREKSDDDGVKGVKGSTRLEAKRQRRRDGRDTSRRRPPILTEAEFLARREAVDRVMAVRQKGDRTQIAVLEDDVLVEHYVTRASATSYVGNVYLGRVQNVLPSMEAAFVDIGKGRNGVLYAGEVNWDAAGLEGKSRNIESALKSGDVVLVQVTKDPIGHKGARLTSQVSLPGRFLVYVPGGGMTGISRKLPDTERHRLKAILKKIVPEDAGVIVRTAAEGASEEELTRDVERLKSQWEKIAKKAEKTSSAPTLVHGEPDLAIRVVRDVFNEDFTKLTVQGDEAWQTISEYVEGVAPDLAERVSRHTADTDIFHALRIDEQLMKALDRKVHLPSGGSLVIDRTEAMTVIDVNTGKFVGSGGNLEQTVTRNNLEAAEEIVRQLRLRDVGGIVVIDFIDMVLESNRDLVLRRLTECLGRDRTKHQVAEVTSLGLVQMTRKRVGEGLLEAFSEPCEHCKGRGVILHADPVDRPASADAPDDGEEERPKAKRKRGGAKPPTEPTPEELAAAEEQRRIALQAITAIHRAAHPDDDGVAATAEDAASAVSDAESAEAGVAEAGVAAPDTAATEPVATEPVAAEQQDLPAAAEAELPVVAEPEAEPVVAEAVERAEAVEPAEAEPAEAEPAEEFAPEPVTRAAPRRRRAASRPAGPPVAVGES